MQNYDTKQIVTWGAVIVGIVALFIGLAYLGGSTPPVAALALPVDETIDHIKGPSTAKVTLVEYSDFECPACAQYEPLVREVLSSYPEDVRLVYRHFPLVQIHRLALPSAKVSEAAQNQGKFWEMHDLLFDRQDMWVKSTSTENTFLAYAEELGLNKEQFTRDLGSDEVQEKVSNDMSSGTASGVNSTPSFYLNGKKITPRSIEEFKSLIDTELATLNK